MLAIKDSGFTFRAAEVASDGSFQENPQHQYANEGIYEVTHVVFNANCGCWNVDKQVVDLIELNRNPCNVTWSWDYQPPNQYQTIQINNIYGFSSTTTVIDIISIEWGDGTGVTVLPTAQSTATHTYINPGTFEVRVIVQFQDGCLADDDRYVFITITDCCDKREREKERVIDSISDTRLRYRDIARGVSVWGPKIKGTHKTWYRNSNGNWKSLKTNQSISYNAKIVEWKPSGSGTPTPGCQLNVKTESGATSETNKSKIDIVQKAFGTMNAFALYKDEKVTFVHNYLYQGNQISSSVTLKCEN